MQFPHRRAVFRSSYEATSGEVHCQEKLVRRVPPGGLEKPPLRRELDANTQQYKENPKPMQALRV
jgi:hypothetical protein